MSHQFDVPIEVAMLWVLLVLYAIAMTTLVRGVDGYKLFGIWHPHMLRSLFVSAAGPLLMAWSSLRSAFDGSRGAIIAWLVGLAAIALIRWRRWYGSGLILVAMGWSVVAVCMAGGLHPSVVGIVIWFSPLLAPGVIIAATPKTFDHHLKVVVSMYIGSAALHWYLFGEEYQRISDFTVVHGLLMFRILMSVILAGLTMAVLLGIQHILAHSRWFRRPFSWYEIMCGDELRYELQYEPCRQTRLRVMRYLSGNPQPRQVVSLAQLLKYIWTGR
ncbi:MAG: hypothetical protein WAU02_04850 [Candidatus Saccharimonadales bacterium]